MRILYCCTFSEINCFLFGRRTSGSFYVKGLNGEKISAGISYKKLRLIVKRHTYLTESRCVSSTTCGTEISHGRKKKKIKSKLRVWCYFSRSDFMWQQMMLTILSFLMAAFLTCWRGLLHSCPWVSM